jgi:hypothetical protein
MSHFPNGSHSAASHSSHKPKSSYHGKGHSSAYESTTTASSHRKTGHHESSRSRMDLPPTLRPSHASSQRETGRYESSRSNLRPAQDRPSRNDYSFSPAANRPSDESYTQASSRHTGAPGSSTLANGQLVKIREVKPAQASKFSGRSESKELMQVPSRSTNVSSRSSAAPSKYSSNDQLRVPGSSRRHVTIDTGNEPVEISSCTAFELTTPDGSTLKVVQELKIKVGDKSQH